MLISIKKIVLYESFFTFSIEGTNLNIILLHVVFLTLVNVMIFLSKSI